MLALAGHPLVHVNAALNTLATILLVAAFVAIKRRNERAHRGLMIAAIVTSAAFLACYLTYHFGVRLTVKFTAPGAIRYVYYFILLTHVVLAMTVPYIALRAASLGMRAMRLSPAGRAGASPEALELRAKHRRLVRWGFPVWLYVSVTGVIVYWMLYHGWPSADLS
jgi:putative membrane protein